MREGQSFAAAGRLAAALLLALAAALPASAAPTLCPPPDKVGEAVEKFSRSKLEVRRVRPAPVAGLCEVVVSVQGATQILYCDATARYFVTGQIIDADGPKDLTSEAMAEYNRFTAEEMKRLESLTALSLGTAGPEFYFVTDPQ